MKTTRAKLVEFLSRHICGDITINDVAYKLIESGLVDVEEEPKEFWLCRDSRGVQHFYTSLFEAQRRMNVPSSCTNGIIHVHSVDQCKKYEKMWNKLKNKLGAYVPESTFSPDYIVTFMEKIELEKGE